MKPTAWEETEGMTDEILELQCNLDDMTPEDMGYALEVLLSEGALDAYTIPIQMKKQRPGVILSCLCRLEDREKMVSLLFRHTTTLGVRETAHRRYILSRRRELRETRYGTVPYKVSQGYGVRREKPEYDALREIARREKLSMEEIRENL